MGVGPGKLGQPEPEPATKPPWIKIYSLYPKPPNPEKALPNSPPKKGGLGAGNPFNLTWQMCIT